MHLFLMKPIVDIVNFFLIWLTLGLAMKWPFQLFLFSYIVIGPVHYLTEINWLDKQDYFLRPKDSRVFVWSMVFLVLLLTAAALLPITGAWQWSKPLHEAIYQLPGQPVQQILRWSWVLLLVAFVMAAAWLFTERGMLRAFIVIVCLLSSTLFYTVPTVAIFFGVLLPTIGHVFLFTILFMTYGTLKTRSSWGWLNIISMPLAVVVIVAWPRTAAYDSLTPSLLQLTLASVAADVNYVINKWLGLLNNGRIDAYSPAFFKAQSFLAFVYTYHYLNWFSKTSIIKWHQVEKKKFIFSAVLWAASLALYKVDYRLGFAAITSLSVLHIVLEFPLNFVSMRGILGAMTAKFKTA
jgi:hypothetical protein